MTTKAHKVTWTEVTSDGPMMLGLESWVARCSCGAHTEWSGANADVEASLDIAEAKMGHQDVEHFGVVADFVSVEHREQHAVTPTAVPNNG